ncbi:MAG: tRNA lysidine(34) synthetase TilS [Planctomycetes bacterium]|nr:tRNA lysidine(34) synthetase TilS [Planctomycetota bacterium]
MVVGHFNHGWRGPESDADELFVKSLAAELGLPMEVGHPAQSAPVLPLGPGEGDKARRTEASARRARYHFLEATATRLGARYVVAAHTADDQAETILQRIIRGTGLAGLAGMRRTRPLGPAVTLIRPLLGFRRDELLTYLQSLGQDYRQDATNADRRFTRNRIRHELLPLLAEHYYPGAAQSLLRLGALASEAQQVIDQQTNELIERCVVQENAALRLDCQVLGSQPQYLIREVIMAAWQSQRWPEGAMGLAEWQRLAEMIFDQGHAPPAPSMFPGGVRACREGRFLVLSARPSRPA